MELISAGSYAPDRILNAPENVIPALRNDVISTEVLPSDII